MTSERVVEPNALFVASELQGFLRSYDEDVNEVSAAILEAVSDVEGKTGLALLTQTWDTHLNEFPSNDNRDEILLPVGPVQSITSFTYVDVDGATQTLVAGTDYEALLPAKSVARLRPITVWPPTKDVYKAISIRYVAGFGDDPFKVPHALRNLIKVRVADLFENTQTQEMTINGVVERPDRISEFDRRLFPWVLWC